MWIELPENVLRYFDRSLIWTECIDDAVVDVEFVELVEDVRCKSIDEVSDDAMESREIRSLRVWLVRLEAYMEGSRLVLLGTAPTS